MKSKGGSGFRVATGDCNTFKKHPKTQTKIAPELCHARTCYDHLAGKLGVALSDALITQDYLVKVDQTYELTEKGTLLAERWGIEVSILKKKRRKFAYACLDWNERRFHVAVSLGAAFAETFFDNGWVKRLPDSRALAITRAGTHALQQQFGIRLE